MKQTLIIMMALVAGAVAYWLISPLFIDKEVQDELDPALQARIEAQRQVDEARERQQAENRSKQEATNQPVLVVEEPEPEVDEYGVRTTGPFNIKSTAGHPATGAVEVIESPEEKLVYFKDYDGTNGPDLRVYLAKDLEAEEFVDLGEAKGNKGNLIYGVPLNVNLSEYKYVLTWCKAFGVLFDYAEIN